MKSHFHISLIQEKEHLPMTKISDTFSTGFFLKRKFSSLCKMTNNKEITVQQRFLQFDHLVSNILFVVFVL